MKWIAVVVAMLLVASVSASGDRTIYYPIGMNTNTTINNTYVGQMNQTPNMTASNLDTSWNLSYYLSDTSRSLTGGYIHRDVNNDVLSIMGGTGGLPYGGNLQLYGGSNVAQSGGAIFAVGNAAGTGSEVVWSVLGNTDAPQMSMSNNKIIDLLDPTNPQDAATKHYVDSVNASLVTGDLTSTNPIALSAAQHVVGGNVNVFLRNDMAETITTIDTALPLLAVNYTIPTSGLVKEYVDNATSDACLNDPTCAYLPGRANGQVLTGSSTSGGKLYLNGSSSNNGNIILNQNGGYVGIGTTPLYTLDIKKNSGSIDSNIRTLDSNGAAIKYLEANPTGNTYAMIMTQGLSRIIGARYGLNPANLISFDAAGNTSGLAIGTIANAPLTIGTNNIARIIINSTGYVTIPNLGAGTVMSASDGTLYVVSDEKTKTDITEYKPISAIIKINGVKVYLYKWNKSSNLPTTDNNLGFITQQLKQFIPEAVSSKKDIKQESILIKKGITHADDVYEIKETDLGTYTDSVSDRAIIAVQVLAIQELDKKIEAQQKTIDELTTRLDKAGIK